ncbi:MAG: hypothetical protein AAGG46_07450, partial [Planctomycetota bacterium]
MASPFKFYRKYTGAFMVFLTVMLMVAFGFGDLIGQGGGGGYGPAADANEVAVAWEGGQLTNGEMRRLVSDRYVARAFHEAVLQLGNEAARVDGTIDLQLRVQPLLLPAIPEEGVERDVVNSKVFVDAAREAGMAVSDDAVKDFIRSLGRDKVRNEQLRLIIGQIARGQGRRLSVEYVFDLIRDALLARNYQQSYTYTLATVLPQQRYRDWLAVNDRLVVEAAVFPAERYLADTPEPTEVELEEFFDEYKGRQPLPDFIGRVELPSPTPGFAIPRRVSLQYLRADYQAAVERASENVTDEEIADYYEENKQQFVKADDLLSDGGLLGGDLFEADTGGESEASDATAEQESDAEESEADTSAADAPAADGQDAEQPANGASSPADPAGGVEAAEQSPSESGAEGSSSSVSLPNPFRLVAFEDAESAAAESENADADDDAPASDDPASDAAEDDAA